MLHYDNLNKVKTCTGQRQIVFEMVKAMEIVNSKRNYHENCLMCVILVDIGNLNFFFQFIPEVFFLQESTIFMEIISSFMLYSCDLLFVKLNAV